MSEKTVHAGHRARLRERFLKEGLSGFSEHEVLELLLMFAIPQKDVNPLAHALIGRFGSLSAVLEASPAELMRVAIDYQSVRRKTLCRSVVFRCA